MKKVYVAGKLSAYGVQYIKNCHRMIDTARKIRRHGMAVYVPCLDILEALHDGDMDYEALFNNSAEWLKASDAMYLTPGWETSTGTNKEIKIAKKRNIPIFEKLEDLVRWDKYGDIHK